MKKYLLSVCIMSLLGATHAMADNIAFSTKKEVSENKNGTMLSFDKNADVNVCPKNEQGECTTREKRLDWNFSERILSDGGTVSFTSTNLNVSAIKDTEGSVFKNNSNVSLLDSTINSDSRLEINSGSALTIGKNSSILIEDKTPTSPENAPAKAILKNANLSMESGLVEQQQKKDVDNSYHTNAGTIQIITTTYEKDPTTGKITKTETIDDFDGTITETVSTISTGGTLLSNKTNLTKENDDDYSMIVDSSQIDLKSKDDKIFIGTTTKTTNIALGASETRTEKNGKDMAIAYTTKIEVGGDIAISNSSIRMSSEVDKDLQDSKTRNLLTSTNGNIVITNTVIDGSNPIDSFHKEEANGQIYFVQDKSMYDRIAAKKDLTLNNTSATVSNVVLESGENMALNTTGSNIVANSGNTSDIKGNYSNLLASAQKDITVNANIENGGLATKENIDWQTGKGSLQSLHANKTTVSNVSDLSLYGGSGTSDLDAYGKLSMYFFTLNGDVYSENSLVDIAWGNAINGDLTLNNSDLKMIKNDTENSVFKVKNLTTTDADLNLDTAHIESSGTVKIDNANITIRISTNKDDNAGFGHITADKIDITNSTLGINVDSGVFSKAGDNKDYAFFNGTTSENLNIETLRSNSRYVFTDNNDGTWNIEMIASASDMAGEQTGNSELSSMAGSLLDGAVGDNKFVQHLNELSQTPGREKDFADGLEILAPSMAAYVSALASDTTRQIYNVIGDRFDRDSYRSRRTRTNAPTNSLWAQGLVSSSEFEGKRTFETDTKGGVIGFDIDPCQGCRFGLGYAYTQSDITAKGREIDVDSHTAVAYADLQSDPVFFNIIASYTRSMYNENKNVIGLMANADYDVDIFSTQAMLGYDMGAIRLSRNWRTGSFIPQIGVKYMNIKQKGYTDTANQTVQDAEAQTITGIAGLHYTADYKMGPVIFYPDLHAAVTYDFVSDELSTQSSLAGSKPYTITAERLDELGVELGAEVGLRIANRVDVALSYLGMFRKDYTNHTGFANLKYKF